MAPERWIVDVDLDYCAGFGLRLDSSRSREQPFDPTITDAWIPPALRDGSEIMLEVERTLVGPLFGPPPKMGAAS